MNSVTVEQVQIAPSSSSLGTFCLDLPRVGSGDGYSFEIAGWMVMKRSPVRRMEVMHGATLVRIARLKIPRPDVAAHLAMNGEPDAEILAAAETSGFMAGVSVLGLPPSFELHVEAVLADDSRVLLATIRGRHVPLRPAYTPRLQPITCNCVGRSGSTLLMGLLADHPEVSVLRQYPYEGFLGLHMLRMIRVLGNPSFWPDEADILKLVADDDAIGPVPFHLREGHPRVNGWMRREYVERLVRFCMETVDAVYGEVAAADGKSGARYFAEKSPGLPNHAELTAALYPEMKEIVLVRDFRDVMCSRNAFFGHIGSIDEAITECKSGLEMLLNGWRQRGQNGFLLRYEDLILTPQTTLTSLLRHLGVDHSPALVAGLLARSAFGDASLKNHVTSSSAEQSIGRWRRELKPEHVELCQRRLGEVLSGFGYGA